MRLKSRASRMRVTGEISALAESLERKGLVSEWHIGSHGEKGKEYLGEEDRYGKNGWKVVQDYFNQGSETAVRLLELKRGSRLENPLWEGGKKNPWRGREEDPLIYQWSRCVHLFTNQLGFDIDREVELCSRQSEKYRHVSKELGIKW